MTAQVDHEVDTPKYKSVRFLTRRSKIRTLVRHPRPPPRSPCRSCALSDDLSPPAPHAPSRWPDRQWAPAAFARRPQRARPLIQVLAPPLSRPTRRCGLSFNGRHASRDRHGAVDSASTGGMHLATDTALWTQLQRAACNLTAPRSLRAPPAPPAALPASRPPREHSMESRGSHPED